MESHLFLLLKSYPESIHNRKKISTKIIHIKNKKKQEKNDAFLRKARKTREKFFSLTSYQHIHR